MKVMVDSFGADVADRQRLNSVLNRYDWEGFLFNIGEDGRLEVGTETLDDLEYGEDWPRAVMTERLPAREAFPDESSWFDEEMAVFSDLGDDGLVALLGEIGLCLKSTLTILAVEFNDNDLDAYGQVWQVEPGESDVKILSATVGMR
ncbi:MAG TPA: hypothetical protein VGL72_10120 [Bryobacteraceae bacterium]|jgi:hypothetical protein